MDNATLTAVPGIAVGHATDLVGATGCTAILTHPAATAAALILGGAASVRQFSALLAGHVSPVVQGVLLAGGSAFGLDAAGGVMRFLEAHGRGLVTPAGVVPVVPTAVIYDLGLGSSTARPDAAMGYAAAAAATTAPVPRGSVGAGTGATVGKIRGVRHATKGGLGSAVVRFGPALIAGALVVTNAFGDVRDPTDGRILAGARDDQGGLLDTAALVRAGALAGRLHFRAATENTTLAVLATNARLTAPDLRRALVLAAAALPAGITPVHTLLDGDVLVGLSVPPPAGEAPAGEPHQMGLLWEEALRAAIVDSVTMATPLAGLAATGDALAPRKDAP